MLILHCSILQYSFTQNIVRSKDVVNGLQDGQQMDHGLLPSQDKRFFFFLELCRPPLWPIQPPAQWISRAPFLGIKLTTHLHLTPKLTMPESHLHSHKPSWCSTSLSKGTASPTFTFNNFFQKNAIIN